jgi:hypothetical protein
MGAVSIGPLGHLAAYLSGDVGIRVAVVGRSLEGSTLPPMNCHLPFT